MADGKTDGEEEGSSLALLGPVDGISLGAEDNVGPSLGVDDGIGLCLASVVPGVSFIDGCSLGATESVGAGDSRSRAISGVGLSIKLSFPDGLPEGTVEGLIDTDGAPLGDGEDGKMLEIVGGVPDGASLVAVGSADGSELSDGLSEGLKLSDGLGEPDGRALTDGLSEGLVLSDG